MGSPRHCSGVHGYKLEITDFSLKNKIFLTFCQRLIFKSVALKIVSYDHLSCVHNKRCLLWRKTEHDNFQGLISIWFFLSGTVGRVRHQYFYDNEICYQVKVCFSLKMVRIYRNMDIGVKGCGFRLHINQ